MSFLVSTSGIAPAVPTATGPYRLDALGLHRGQRALYFLERVTARDPRGAPVAETPMLHVMHLSGEQTGRLSTALGWYQGSREEIAAGFDARLLALRSELTPLEPVASDGWTLTTRVVQHRALRLPDGQPAIRKFALSLQVDPVYHPILDRHLDGQSPRPGRTSVTAYLRPRAMLDGVWAIPGEPWVVARVAYVGVPSDAGHDKHTAVLVRRGIN
jgi:hypothetical protein